MANIFIFIMMACGFVISVLYANHSSYHIVAMETAYHRYNDNHILCLMATILYFRACLWAKYAIIKNITQVLVVNSFASLLQFFYLVIYYTFTIRKVRYNKYLLYFIWWPWTRVKVILLENKSEIERLKSYKTAMKLSLDSSGLNQGPPHLYEIYISWRLFFNFHKQMIMYKCSILNIASCTHLKAMSTIVLPMPTVDWL